MVIYSTFVLSLQGEEEEDSMRLETCSKGELILDRLEE